MGVLVDTHQKFYNRLNDAIALDGLLYGIKKIRVGYARATLSKSDYPFVLMTEIVENEAGNTIGTASSYRSVPCRFSLFIYNDMETSDSNHLYDISAETGPLYLKEKVIDCLFTPDTIYGGYVKDIVVKSEMSEMMDKILITRIDVSFSLIKSYAINSRRTAEE